MKKIRNIFKYVFEYLGKVWYIFTIIMVFAAAIVAGTYGKSFSIDVLLVLFALDISVLFFMYSLFDKSAKDLDNGKVNAKSAKEFLSKRTKFIYILLLLLGMCMITYLTIPETNPWFYIPSNILVALEILYILQCVEKLQAVYTN